MKKKIVSLALAVCLLAIAAVGTLAYFTDSKSAENTFTVGNVKIDLLESNLHRENAGVKNGETSTSELWSNVEMAGQPNTDYTAGTGAAYSDAQIKADAAQYKCEDVKLNPGESYHKMPYVVNTGANDAYIRIRVMFPAALDTAVLNSSMYTSSAMNSGEFTMAVKNNYKTVNGILYNAYEFTRVKPLAAGEMTYWNVWGTVHMDTDVTNDEIAQLIPTGKFSVLVEADAIQADGFADATAAWAAFPAN